MDTMLDELRKRIEDRHLGHELPDRVWGYLLEKRLPQEVLGRREGDFTEADLAAEAKSLMGLGLAERPRRTIPASTRDAAETGNRAWALSIACAVEAATDRLVQSFRTDVLGGQLLKSLEDVEPWILAQAEADGPASTILSVPVEISHSLRHVRGGIVPDPAVTIDAENPARAFTTEFLDYARPGDRLRHTLPIRHGGTLDMLRTTSELLARRYGWAPAQATVFVLLEDYVPAVPSLVGGVRVSFDRPHLTRITMTIDPVTSPNEVAEQYRELRSRMMGARRYRPQERKSLELAVRALRHADDCSWGDEMQRWNDDMRATHPDWTYSDAGSFGHDCREAAKRLLDVPFKPERGLMS